MSLEPGNEFSEVAESLIVKVESCAFDFDEFLDWFLVSIHVDK